MNNLTSSVTLPLYTDIYLQIAVTHSINILRNECFGAGTLLFDLFYIKNKLNYFLENYAYLLSKILIQGCSTALAKMGKAELINYFNHNNGMQEQLPEFSGRAGTVS